MAGKSPGCVDDRQGTLFNPSLDYEVSPLRSSDLRGISPAGVTSLEPVTGNSGEFPQSR